jgi:hyperosmotically inducible protein
MKHSSSLYLMALTGSALLVSACASTRTQKSFGEGVDDAAITTRVKTALIADPITKARDIDVAVFKGRVQLNGFVDSAEERTEAAAVASRVSGVTNVEDNLAVKTGSRTVGEALDDATISTKVKAALIADERTKAHQIDVQTHDGTVLLGGFVDNSVARAAATEVTAAVTGVVKVDNQLTVK